MKMTIKIGTSGFSFDDWKGIVYPQHLKKEDWLRYYEKELGFNTLEVNFTYYTLPSPRSLEGMSRKTSESFQFAVKAFKGMTHEIKDKDTNIFLNNKRTFDQFLHSLKPLIDTGKLGCVLAQFPFSFYPKTENLEYLKRFKELMGTIPLIIEFRNRSWLKEKTLQFLKEHLMGYCVVDEPKLPQLMTFHPEATSEIGYFRFHGRNRNWFNVPTSVRYNYLYSEEELKEFIPPIKMIASKTDKVFIFFNNCHAGSAAKNATMLIRMLQEKGD
jgi:uncharacterized protein YecE (DUF72 family)